MKKILPVLVLIVSVLLLAGCNDRVRLDGRVGISLSLEDSVMYGSSKSLSMTGTEWSAESADCFDISITDESGSSISYCSISAVSISGSKRTFGLSKVTRPQLESAIASLIMSQGLWSFRVAGYTTDASDPLNPVYTAVTSGNATEYISVRNREVKIYLSKYVSASSDLTVEIGTSSNPVYTSRTNASGRLALYIDDISRTGLPLSTDFNKHALSSNAEYDAFYGSAACTLDNSVSSYHTITVVYEIPDISGWAVSRGRTFGFTAADNMVLKITGELDEEEYQSITLTIGSYSMTFGAFTLSASASGRTDTVNRADAVVKKGSTVLTEGSDYTVTYRWYSNVGELSVSPDSSYTFSSEGPGSYGISCTAVVHCDGQYFSITQYSRYFWVGGELTAVLP